MNNQDLKQTYDKMHSQGKAAWFDDGCLERLALLEIGQPWTDKTVLEIGCGEGDLLQMIGEAGGIPHGIDYSAEAIKTLRQRYPDKIFPVQGDWRDVRIVQGFDVIVMQGVLEHLDDPFADLAQMIERFKPETIVMSMPGFINTRGIIWHTLNMLGAVMSKTDLHFIDPWEVQSFCDDYGHNLKYNSIEYGWGEGPKMVEDLKQRIPLALRDGNIVCEQGKFDQFMAWLEQTSGFIAGSGAVNIYRIDI